MIKHEALCRTQDPARRTIGFMYRCNLNFERFNRYLRELLDAGVVECVRANPDEVVLYKTTKKGRELLMVLRKASELMSI